MLCAEAEESKVCGVSRHRPSQSRESLKGQVSFRLESSRGHQSSGRTRQGGEIKKNGGLRRGDRYEECEARRHYHSR